MQAAVVQHGHLVRGARHDVELVRCQRDRRAGVGQRPQPRQRLDDVIDVEVGGGLVERQDAR